MPQRTVDTARPLSPLSTGAELLVMESVISSLEDDEGDDDDYERVASPNVSIGNMGERRPGPKDDFNDVLTDSSDDAESLGRGMLLATALEPE